MQRRILLAFLGLLAVVIVSILIINTWSMRRAIRSYNLTHSAAHAELLPSFLILYYDSNQTWEGIEYELIQLSILAGTEVTIVDSEGLIIASTATPDVGLPFDVPPQLDQELEILDDAGDLVGRVYVRFTENSLGIDQALSTNLTNGLSLTIGIVSVAALMIAYYLSRSISRPIKRIESAARLLAKGEYGVRLAIPQTRDEVAALAKTFNQMAAGLDNVETMRRQLVADVSHDFRTPLTVLRGYLDGLISGRIIDRPSAVRAFNAMHSEISYLDGLVDTMRQAAELDSGRLTLRREVFSLHAPIQAALGRLEPIIEEHQATVVDEIEGSDLMLFADRRMLIQLVYNLVNNAIHHNPEPVTITLSADEFESEVALRVSDNGIGIDPSFHDRVFERFFRLDPARGRSQGGSGMGLAIVESIAQAHGGRVEVESPTPAGNGVTFHVYFPI